MSGPLNVQPQGLLSLFDLKSGRYPSELGEQLSPTLDLLDWFTDTRPLETVEHTYPVMNANADQNGFAPGATLTAGISEYWYVRRYWILGVFTAAGASQIQGLVPTYVSPGAVLATTDLPFNASFAQPYSSNAAMACAVEVHLRTPIIMPPGAGLSVRHLGFQFGAATLTVTARAQILRMRS